LAVEVGKGSSAEGIDTKKPPTEARDGKGPERSEPFEIPRIPKSTSAAGVAYQLLTGFLSLFIAVFVPLVILIVLVSVFVVLVAILVVLVPVFISLVILVPVLVPVFFVALGHDPAPETNVGFLIATLR
jgi:uncharacterized membrane protein